MNTELYGQIPELYLSDSHTVLLITVLVLQLVVCSVFTWRFLLLYRQRTKKLSYSTRHAREMECAYGRGVAMRPPPCRISACDARRVPRAAFLGSVRPPQNENIFASSVFILARMLTAYVRVNVSLLTATPSCVLDLFPLRGFVTRPYAA